MPRSTKEYNGKTKYAFTKPNAVAGAIETAAEFYPEDEIKIKVKPIRTGPQAMSAYRRVIKSIQTSGAVGYEQNLPEVMERYRRLGETGSSSLVEMEIPGGGLQFDFKAFYTLVNQIVKEGGQQG